MPGKTRCQGYAFDGFNSPIEAFPLNLTFSPGRRNSVFVSRSVSVGNGNSAGLAVGLYSGLGSG